MHVKIDNDAVQRTVLGGAVTLVAFVVVLYLLLSEISAFKTTDIVTRMMTDNTIGRESIRIEFDLEFAHVVCDRISFMQEVTRGDMHIHEPEFVQKQDLHDPQGGVGCWVRGYTVTDKAAGNFRFHIEPEPPKAANQDPNMPNMLPGFGLGGMHFEMFQVPELPLLSHKVNHVIFKPVDMDTSLSKTLQESGIEDVQMPLQGQSTELDARVAIQHYSLSVVPTHFKPLGASTKKKHVNQYSFLEKQVTLDTIANQMGNVMLAGQQLHKVLGACELSSSPP